MSDNASVIKSRGHWLAVIRPEPFNPDRVPYTDLERILTAATVRLRGWPVPFIEYGEVLHGGDWIGGEGSKQSPGRESWRFYTSGQFVHLNVVGSDWGDGVVAVPSGAAPVIAVWEILFYVTEIVELATRLAVGTGGSDLMTVALTLNGLENRELVVGDPRRGEFNHPMRTSMASHRVERSFDRARLVAAPGKHSAEMARGFFSRFGWDAPVDLLLDYQQEVLRDR